MIILFQTVIAIQSISCVSLDDPGILSPGDRMTWNKIIDTYIFPTKPLNESLVLPNAHEVYHYDNSSEAIKTALFYSNLCRTSNCRASLDKWDCENCVSTLPDGMVIRSFQTYPLGVTGQIILSEKKKTIFIVIRGASSLRTKLLFFDGLLVRHPLVPGIKVQRGALDALYDIREIVYSTVTDQLILHPNYKIDIVGHSFGGAIGSLLAVDLYQRLPFYYSSSISGYFFGKPRVGDIKYAKFVAKNKISIRRYNEENDDVAHQPSLEEGYMHEGDEYWLKSKDKLELQTKNCSSSVPFTSSSAHLSYFGILQTCENDIFNIF
ncbi:Alpha/Beta hydrolase protein [Thamnidium elegans]|nr:Alpha/Beta hydrolase protein [Thamnidium elegans]